MNNSRRRALGLSSAILLSAYAAPTLAEELPVFELGLGVGAIYQNYYPGTEDTRTFGFPAIIPVYRGERLKSDEEGVRAELAKDSRFRLDLSVEFNLAIESEEITLREGMPDINNILQIGPSFQYSMYKDSNEEWLLRLPLRAGVGFGEEETEYVGLASNPDFTYLREMQFLNKPWRLGLSLGPQFATSDYHDVFYRVAPEFATADRPAYETDGGLSGYRFLATFSSKTPERIASIFLRAQSLSGAVIEDSPLVETDTSLTVGFIYSWMVFKSKRLVSQ